MITVDKLVKLQERFMGKIKYRCVKCSRVYNSVSGRGADKYRCILCFGKLRKCKGKDR